MCTISNDPGCFSLRKVDKKLLVCLFFILPGDHSADTSSVGTTSDHAEVADLEGDDVLHLVGGQVQLDAVVHLGVGVRVPDGAAVAGVKVRDTLGASGDSPHPAELVGSLGGGDPVDGEASLDVVDDPEVLAGLVNLDHVHETGGELGVGPGLAINLDQALLHDGLDLLHGDGVLQTVPQEKTNRKALSLLVGAGAPM